MTTRRKAAPYGSKGSIFPHKAKNERSPTTSVCGFGRKLIAFVLRLRKGHRKRGRRGRKALRRPRHPQTALHRSRALFRSTGGRARRRPQRRRPAGRRDEADVSWGVLLSGAAEVGLPKMAFGAAGRRNAERAFAAESIIARFSQGGNNTANGICEVLQNFGGAVKCAVNFPETTKKRKNQGHPILFTQRGCHIVHLYKIEWNFLLTYPVRMVK